MLVSIFSTIYLVLGSLWMNGDVASYKPVANDWTLIAERKVDFGVDHDVILFSDMKDDYRQLKFKVSGAPMHIYDVKVHYDSGAVQDVAVKTFIKEGGETRVIDLNGGKRHLRKIEFTYETKGFMDGKASFAVWGHK